MATIRQRRAVQNLVETRGNVSLAMRQAGYEPKTAKNPKNLTESKGFEGLLKEYGLTEELVVSALVSDIKGKPKKRSAELSLGADILGLKKAEKNYGRVTNIFNIYDTGQLERIAARVLHGESESTGTPRRLPDSDKSKVRTQLAP